VTQKSKGAENSYGGTRRIMQTQPKILKNHRNTKSTNYQSKPKFSQKKGAQNSYWGYPTEFAGSTQNVKKNCRNIQSTNQNKKFPNKNMFSALKV
jgi:predicted SPOUT superfamily RNA methylase MTH1